MGLTASSALPILTLALGAIGGFCSKWLLDHLAYRRERTQRLSAFQREILLDLQDSQLPGLRAISEQRWKIIRKLTSTTKVYATLENSEQEPNQKELQPRRSPLLSQLEEVHAAFHKSQEQIMVAATRIRDKDIRNDLLTVAAIALTNPNKSSGKVEDELTAALTDLNARIGILLRKLP